MLLPTSRASEGRSFLAAAAADSAMAKGTKDEIIMEAASNEMIEASSVMQEDSRLRDGRVATLDHPYVREERVREAFEVVVCWGSSAPYPVCSSFCERT